MKERSGIITMKGNPLVLLGEEIKVGQSAPDCTLVANDLSEIKLSSFTDLRISNGTVSTGSVSSEYSKNRRSIINAELSKGKKILLSVVPSLDTGICDTQTKKFNVEAGKLGSDVVVLTISMDLPFAQKRWCGAANVSHVKTLSDHRDASFGINYGVLIKGL